MHSDTDPFITTPARQPPTPPIFLRDFAYPDSARVVFTERMRMASERSIAKSLARDFAELLSGPMVEIYVGKERKQWSLHRNLLCHHSPYFETELLGHELPKKQNGDDSNKLELPEDDPRGFELFVKWLYQGQLDDVSELDNNGKYEYAVACHKLYLLSTKFSMPHLSNIAMDAYRQNLNAAHLVPDADEINDIYRSSPPGSPFRRLMTKIAARQIMDPEVDKDAETYRAAFENNPDFAVEMVNAIRYMSGGILFDNPTDGTECDWHDHSDGSHCQGGKGKGKASVPYTNGVSGTSPYKPYERNALNGNTGSQTEGASSKRIQSPTMTRVRATPLAELPTDKRTPRKLNLPPQQTVTKPGAQQTSTTRGKGRVPSTPLQNATGVSPSPTKPVAGKPRPVLGKRASSHTNGVKAPTTPPRKTASANASPVKVPHRPREQAQDSPPKPLANCPVITKGASNVAASTDSPPRKGAAPRFNVNARRAVSGPAQVNGCASSNGKAKEDSSSANGFSKNTSPDQGRNQVNGIVRQLNGTASSKSTSKAVREQDKGTALDGFSVNRAGEPSEAGTTDTAAKSVAETTTGSSEGLDRREPVKMKRKVPG